MNKQLFKEINVIVEKGAKAVEVYGADTNLIHPNNKAYYNTGIDSVLNNVAAIALKEMAIDLDEFENELESYQYFEEGFQKILDSGCSNISKESIKAQYNSIFDWVATMEKEYFERGFNAGYKFSKNAENM